MASAAYFSRTFFVLLGVGFGFVLNQLFRMPFSLENMELDSPINRDDNDDSIDDSHSVEEGELGFLSQSGLQKNTSATMASGPSHSRTIETTEDIPSRPSNCKEILQRLLEWNHCWRQKFLWMKHQPKDSNIFTTGLLRNQDMLLCPVTDNDEAGSKKFEIVGAPMYHFAYYQGQGFGRFIDHSVEACITAFVLGRACIINMSPRDPNYTWRSFIHVDTYQWEPSLIHSIPEYAQQLEKLAQELPKIGAGEWDRKSFKVYPYALNQSLVFPMQRKFAKDKWVDAIQYYHANNTNNTIRPSQVLFSPNWADAWFTKFPLANIFRQDYNCGLDVAKTIIQNAMYAPTDLTQSFHQTRYKTARYSGSWFETKKSRSDEPTTKKSFEGGLRILPHAMTATTPTPQDYGSIHLRMHFLNFGRRTPIEKDEVVTLIQNCLKGVTKTMPNDQIPLNWWLLADDSTMAVQVADGIREHPMIPKVNIFHDYNATTTTNKRGVKLLSTQHSMGASAKGLFSHPVMAGAVGDWMAIHSSKVAVVVHTGAFGTTGARGNGKLPRAYCGNSKEYASNNEKLPFQIFF